jgi:hypothetical protein
MLEKAGIKNAGTLDRGQASALISQIIGRRESGQASYKMAAILAKYGLNPDVPFEDAIRAVAAIKAAGWKKTNIPASLYNDPVFNPAHAKPVES